MLVFVFTFLLGCVAGLRSLTAPALVCWAARLGWLHLEGTWLSFTTHPATLTILTLLAVAELAADKLPFAPARTAPIGLIARLITAMFSGAAIALGRGTTLYFAAIAAVGAVAGAFAGYHLRRTLVVRGKLPDFLVALAEDAVAVGAGVLVLWRLSAL